MTQVSFYLETTVQFCTHRPKKNNLYINLLKYQMCQRAVEDLRFLGQCQETCACLLETVVVVPLDAGSRRYTLWYQKLNLEISP